MADRSSAEIFGNMFILLASDPTEQHKKWARQLWSDSGRYDFSPYQMYADEYLEILDLARKRVDPENPGDGEVWFFGPEGRDKP